jgi:hypothetical protein
MINIVCDLNLINSNLHTDILLYVERNKINLDDLILSSKPFKSYLNLFYINDINSYLISHIDDFPNSFILQNEFFLNLKNNLGCKKSLRILNHKSIEIAAIENITSYRKINSIQNISFYIREESPIRFKLEAFLKILSIYYDFNYSFNHNTPNSLKIHVLTPAKDDIAGISITQIIMSLQRNQIPISFINENALDGLYVPYNFSLKSLELLLLSCSNKTINLNSIKNNFKNHDFSNLFK